MSEQQWYCPNCGPEISVTVERIHTFSGPDDYIVCTGCGETVDEKAETPAFVLALQQRIDEQREKVATWIMSLGLSTGHGDTLEDLLKEAHWQVREYQQRIATLEAAISEMTTDPSAGGGVMKRLRAAMRTNEPQVISVVALTAMNAAALVSRDAYAPMWLVVGALLFWPLLAFLANLHNPIPPEVEG